MILAGEFRERGGHGSPDLGDNPQELQNETAADDKCQEHYRDLVSSAGLGNSPATKDIPTQPAEMGGLGVCLGLETGPFPRFAASFFANRSFARRCWGVCACAVSSGSIGLPAMRIYHGWWNWESGRTVMLRLSGGGYPGGARVITDRAKY